MCGISAQVTFCQLLFYVEKVNSKFALIKFTDIYYKEAYIYQCE